MDLTQLLSRISNRNQSMRLVSVWGTEDDIYRTAVTGASRDGATSRSISSGTEEPELGATNDGSNPEGESQEAV